MVKSHVPSPTVRVSDEYELEPGEERVSAGAMAGDARRCCPVGPRRREGKLVSSRVANGERADGAE